jgi:PAS domain S-box-containing protein
MVQNGSVGSPKIKQAMGSRKQTDDALRENEELRLLVSGVKDYAILMLDTEGRVTTWNEGAERIKGYRAEEIIGQNFSRFYTPEAIAAKRPEKELELAAARGRYQEEGWRVRKDGSRFFADVVITAVATRLANFAALVR